MLSDRQNLLRLHLLWLLGTLALSIAAVGWYYVEYSRGSRLPGGGSWPGLTFGIVAGLIILFEFALWPRKTSLFRTSRWLGKTQIWMKAHIWLGLLSVSLVFMHSGFHWGGTYTTLFAGFFAAVILSGLFGLLMQNLLPRLLLDAIPGETVASQIDEVAGQYADDARRLVAMYCDDIPETHAASHQLQLTAGGRDGKPLVGVRRHVGMQVKRSLNPEIERPQRTSSPELVRGLTTDVEPYLRSGNNPRGLLGTRQKNRWYFEDLRRKSPPEVHAAVDAIEELCDRRRQLHLQQRIQFWLHSWLIVHLPLSAILVVLLIGHVLLALRYS